MFTLPSKYATILPFLIGRSVTLEGRLARLVRRTLISINVLAKDNDKRDLFQIAGYNSPKNSSDVIALIYKHFKMIKSLNISWIKRIKSEGLRYSLDTDEYTSISKKRFLSVNIFSKDCLYYFNITSLKRRSTKHIFYSSIAS